MRVFGDLGRVAFGRFGSKRYAEPEGGNRGLNN